MRAISEFLHGILRPASSLPAYLAPRERGCCALDPGAMSGPAGCRPICTSSSLVASSRVRKTFDRSLGVGSADTTGLFPRRKALGRAQRRLAYEVARCPPDDCRRARLVMAVVVGKADTP